MYIVYGIKNCDTVKKALRWLEDHHITYQFHDFKSKGVSDELLRSWSDQGGWEELLNRKGLTWKQLPEDVRGSISNEKAAFALLKEKTSIIRRPVIEREGKIVVRGFNEAEYSAVFGDGV